MPRRPESVATRQDFAEYVRALGLNESPDSENPTTARFLEALAAWVEDWPHPLEPSWGTFAEMLTAATIYE